MIEFLKIKNFKAFKDFEIKDLSSINIFVGKANTGKTTILEALSFLYESPTNRTIDYDLDARGLKNSNKTIIQESQIYEDGAFESLFYDIDTSQKIEISTNVRKLELTFSEKKTMVIGNSAQVKKILKPHYEPKSIPDTVNLIHSNHKAELLNNLYAQISNDNHKKKEFVDYLKSFDEDFYECELKNDSLYIRTKSLSKAINIKQMGQGVVFYATICALLVRGDKVIIIDELENGLHYSALKMALKIIFDKAKDKNIQFFISTHSRELLEKANSMLDNHEFSQDLLNVFSVFKNSKNEINYIKYEQEEFIEQINLENEIRSVWWEFLLRAKAIKLS